jgi:hypothetical protein
MQKVRGSNPLSSTRWSSRFTGDHLHVGSDIPNVAPLVDTPKGQPGRPSKALTAEQAAAAVLKAAEGSRLGGYVI